MWPVRRFYCGAVRRSLKKGFFQRKEEERGGWAGGKRRKNLVKEEGWLSWLRAPAECAAAGKENPALQTSCFCCVPTRPKLSLTERGQIPPRRDNPWARVGPGHPAELWPCQTSPRCEARTCTRPEEPHGQRISRAFTGLPPAAPENIPSLRRASPAAPGPAPRPLWLQEKLPPEHPVPPRRRASPSPAPARARRASVGNQPASKQLMLTKPGGLSSLLPGPLLVELTPFK